MLFVFVFLTGEGYVDLPNSLSLLLRIEAFLLEDQETLIQKGNTK